MESQTSTALSILSSPEANDYVEKRYKDLDFGNEKVLLMNNVVQRYTAEEDEMIVSALRLVSAMKTKGAIPFQGELDRDCDTVIELKLF